MHEASNIAGGRLRLPPERFFWGLLDGSVIRRRTADPRHQLGYLFEAVLPLSIDQVHAQYSRIPGGKQFVACGMDQETLQGEIANHGGALIHLGPAALPGFLQEGLSRQHVALERFNLLSGQFEPPAVRMLRRRWEFQIIALVFVTVTLLVIGLERRTAMVRKHLSEINDTRASLYSEVMPAGGKQPPALQLTVELCRLRHTHAPGRD